MTKKKIKVSIHEIIKLSNYANPNFGSFASFLKGLADSDGFIEVDSHNESVDQPTTPEKKCCEKCQRMGRRNETPTVYDVPLPCTSSCPCHQEESEKRNDVY